MKRKRLFAVCLALLMLLSLAPMALAAELPFDAAWFQGVSLRNLINEGQGQIDLAGGSFLAGEVAGMCRKEESAREIVLDIVEGAERIMKEKSSIYGC